MSNFRVFSSLLIIYLMIGLFGSNFGVESSVLRDLTNIDRPVETSLFQSLFSFVDFMFSLAILPLTILISNTHPVNIFLIEIISVLFYIQLAIYVRGNS